MDAYGALVSVMHIVEQIQNHPRPPISLDKKLAQSLTENVTFLQDYLENYSFLNSKEACALEIHIADVACEAEDIIESHIADTVEAHGENTSSTDDLYGGIQKVIREMESIKNEVSTIKEKMTVKMDQPVPRVGSSSTGSNSTTVVGLDDVLIEVMDKLTGQQSAAAGLQIIPIVGMGGIGKTTLARSVYVNPLIVQHFDFLGWATISQEFNSKEIILEILACLKGTRESLSQMSEHELGQELYKILFGTRYIIVLDDIWSIEAWNKVKIFFPNNNSDGSAIILTTRLSNFAHQLSGSDDFLKMSFLDDHKSWNLFCKCAFGQEDCPIGLEEMGMKISKACKGLPLSITVMGGLLARHKQSRRYWEYILENLNSVLNSEDNEHCLRILHMSYKELPVHLKPCFLYMGAFPEDSVIVVSSLIRLWVAEGFLKPISGKSLEIAAEEYLRDLVDRNLVLVDKWGHTGEIKYCEIHDLLRDLCLKVAWKDKFLCFKKAHEFIRSPHDIQGQRRIGFQGSVSVDEDYGASQSDSLRSLLCDFPGGDRYLPFLDSRLLRVLRAPDNIFSDYENYSTQDIFLPANLRYLEIFFTRFLKIPNRAHHFWNLQTIDISGGYGDVISAPVEIWKMPQLRHVMVRRLELPDPPTDDKQGLVVLGNLQTLELVKNFKCGEDVLKRIPNVKKLKIYYWDAEAYSLDNLCRLSKLESLSCDFRLLSEEGRSRMLPYLDFPPSLRELSLQGMWLRWEDVMMTKIGSLPCLQVLKLCQDSFVGPEWETVQGQFGSLIYLRLYDCNNLQYWRTESSHFPCLEQLVLQYLFELKEIPSEIGDILTLKTIRLDFCKRSAVISAEGIRQQQEELGNVGLQVVVRGIN